MRIKTSDAHPKGGPGSRYIRVKMYAGSSKARKPAVARSLFTGRECSAMAQQYLPWLPSSLFYALSVNVSEVFAVSSPIKIVISSLDGRAII